MTDNRGSYDMVAKKDLIDPLSTSTVIPFELRIRIFIQMIKFFSVKFIALYFFGRLIITRKKIPSFKYLENVF